MCIFFPPFCCSKLTCSLFSHYLADYLAIISFFFLFIFEESLFYCACASSLIRKPSDLSSLWKWECLSSELRKFNIWAEFTLRRKDVWPGVVSWELSKACKVLVLFRCLKWYIVVMTELTWLELTWCMGLKNRMLHLYDWKWLWNKGEPLTMSPRKMHKVSWARYRGNEVPKNPTFYFDKLCV